MFVNTYSMYSKKYAENKIKIYCLYCMYCMYYYYKKNTEDYSINLPLLHNSTTKHQRQRNLHKYRHYLRSHCRDK